MSGPFSSSTSSSSGHGSKDMLIREMPPNIRRQLIEYLDELDVWIQLAEAMQLRESDLQNIRIHQRAQRSPTDQLLKIWGGQYNHTITELYFIFKKKKLHQAMRLIKDLVERKYHILIPISQPKLSSLMAAGQARNASELSRKLLNCNTSSGVSNSNNSSSTNITNSIESEQSNADFISDRKMKEYTIPITQIPYSELTQATNNWSDDLRLGKGGFGIVYKGYWKHTDVAIKLLNYGHSNGQKVEMQQSLNELKYLSGCRHDNVLQLYGISLMGEKKCLVYELMTGGNLDERLHSKNWQPLKWKERLSICLGTARGINYLHTFRGNPLIHGDIKPANVLLSECLVPKIGDFGLAREGPNTVNSTVEVSQIFGTRPYLPPEFLNYKMLSTQVDTYSYGVIVLEVFTGLKVIEKKRQPLGKYIIEYFAVPENRIADLIDKRIGLTLNQQSMCEAMIQLGRECIASMPEQRPKMEVVLNDLRHLQEAFNQSEALLTGTRQA